MSRLEIVVFGATGFAGKFVVRELVSTFKDQKVTWGIAGRSQQKLNDLLNTISAELNTDLTHVETIIVDIEDEASIKKMCERAQVIINCVGPYRFFGEQVVKECLAAQTHHVDVSGEPEYLERMQYEYNKEAEEKNVFIVGSCGFDSIPADMGLVYTQNNSKTDLSYVESFLTIESQGKISFNFGTWESAVYGFASAKNLGVIRKQLFKTRLPKPEHPAPKRTNMLGFYYDDVLKKYCLPFMGSDKSVVQRTQYFNNEVLHQKPVQYAPYFTISSIFSVILFLIFGFMFSVLANFSYGRYLLLKYYNIFSCGLASKSETPAKNMEKTKFKFQFRGVGHSKPDQLVITEMNGPEPGYVTTSRLIILSALVLLQEKDKIPVKGGVLTPGAAFAKTTLLDRMQNYGISLNVVESGSGLKDKST